MAQNRGVLIVLGGSSRFGPLQYWVEQFSPPLFRGLSPGLVVVVAVVVVVVVVVVVDYIALLLLFSRIGLEIKCVVLTRSFYLGGKIY